MGNLIYYPIVGSGGSVTSVSFTGDGILFQAAPGPPVTTTGTLFPTLLVQEPNTILAGPAAGPSATPTFRGLIVADLPTSGTWNFAGTITGVTINASNVDVVFVTKTNVSYLATAADRGTTFNFVLTSGNKTLTLPAISPGVTWWIAALVNGAGNLTINPNGNLLDGSSASQTLSQSAGNFIYTDGTNYFLFCGSVAFGAAGQVAFYQFANQVTGDALLTDSGTLLAYTGTAGVQASIFTSPAFVSTTTNPATAGILRLANMDSIEWRNAANNGNFSLSLNSSNYLVYNGIAVVIGAGSTTYVALNVGSGGIGVLTSLSGDGSTWIGGSGQIRVTDGVGGAIITTSLTVPTIIEPTADTQLLFTGSTLVTTGHADFSFTGTWNAGGSTFTGIRLNVTDTASLAASLLLDLQTSTVSQFKVDKSGNLTLLGTINGLDLNTQTANTVLAGPASGSAAAPTFRQLVVADIPSLQGAQFINAALPPYNLIFDAAAVSDGSIANGSTTLTSASANWTTTAKTGQRIWGVEGSGGNQGRLAFMGTIISITSSTQIEISQASNCTTTNPCIGLNVAWGTGNQNTAAQAFIAAISSNTNPLPVCGVLPTGGFVWEAAWNGYPTFLVQNRVCLISSGNSVLFPTPDFAFTPGGQISFANASAPSRRFFQYENITIYGAGLTTTDGRTAVFQGIGAGATALLLAEGTFANLTVTSWGDGVVNWGCAVLDNYQTTINLNCLNSGGSTTQGGGPQQATKIYGGMFATEAATPVMTVTNFLQTFGVVFSNANYYTLVSSGPWQSFGDVFLSAKNTLVVTGGNVFLDGCYAPGVAGYDTFVTSTGGVIHLHNCNVSAPSGYYALNSHSSGGTIVDDGTNIVTGLSDAVGPTFRPLAAGGPVAGLTGTGACATITTQLGGTWSGSAVCTGSTGASTLVITPGTSAPNGWACSGSDISSGLALSQSGTSTTTCTLSAALITSNDVVTFMAVAY